MATKKMTKRAKGPTPDEQEELMRRSFAAWFRGGNMDQPSQESSAVETHGGKVYVVLRNQETLMAVYRVRNDGMLKGMRRWPKSIE
jgi:hypothetical protein